MSHASLKADLRAIVGEQGMLEGEAVRVRGNALFHGRVADEEGAGNLAHAQSRYHA